MITIPQEFSPINKKKEKIHKQTHKKASILNPITESIKIPIPIREQGHKGAKVITEIKSFGKDSLKTIIIAIKVIIRSKTITVIEKQVIVSMTLINRMKVMNYNSH